jgi:hypothetical protein
MSERFVGENWWNYLSALGEERIQASTEDVGCAGGPQSSLQRSHSYVKQQSHFDQGQSEGLYSALWRDRCKQQYPQPP